MIFHKILLSSIYRYRCFVWPIIIFDTKFFIWQLKNKKRKNTGTKGPRNRRTRRDRSDVTAHEYWNTKFWPSLPSDQTDELRNSSPNTRINSKLLTFRKNAKEKLKRIKCILVKMAKVGCSERKIVILPYLHFTGMHQKFKHIIIYSFCKTS